MKLKSLLLLILFGVLGYWLYDYGTTQFSQEVMTYKRYASALLEGDASKVKNFISNNDALKPFQDQKARMEFLNGEQRFVWYRVDHKRFSQDRKTVDLRVTQWVRVDPPGADSFFGTEVRKDVHNVTLVKEQSAWRVERFRDSVSVPALAN